MAKYVTYLRIFNFLVTLFIFWLFPEKFRVCSFWRICLIFEFSRKIQNSEFSVFVILSIWFWRICLFFEFSGFHFSVFWEFVYLLNFPGKFRDFSFLVTWGSIFRRSLNFLPTVMMDSEAFESPSHTPILSPFVLTETTAPLTYKESDKFTRLNLSRQIWTYMFTVFIKSFSY